MEPKRLRPISGAMFEVDRNMEPAVDGRRLTMTLVIAPVGSHPLEELVFSISPEHAARLRRAIDDALELDEQIQQRRELEKQRRRPYP